MRSHTKCTQTTHAQGCALTQLWTHIHTLPGLCPHPGVDTHTHTPRAAPHPGVDTHTHAQGCALTQLWTHTHAQGCALTQLWTHTHTPRAAPSPGCGHTHLKLSCCCLHCHRCPDKNTAFYCTARHRLSSIHHTLHFIHPHIKTQASLTLPGLG